MAFKIHGERKVYLLKFNEINTPWKNLPPQFRNLWGKLIDERYLFTAHNALFETCIYKNILVKRYGWPDIPFRSFRCTAAKAAACALPRNLEGAGAALKLTTQKDKRGYIAMMATCKPTRQWNAWNKKQQVYGYLEDAPPKFLTPEANLEIWETLYRYCKIDVLTEELLDDALPDLNPFEQEVWFLNQQINWRGIRIDIPTVQKIMHLMERENKLKLKELGDITMGLVTKPGARKAILDFLALEGVKLADIRAKTVEDALQDEDVKETPKRLLQLRQALSKTSTKKYQAFIDRCMPDGHARDILLYSGASTGRDAGTGLQIQNFPRGLLKVDKDFPYTHIENIIDCDEETLHFFYGETLSILFSAVLRNVIIPDEGYDLFVADFAKIEVAFLWWLSGNEAGLEILNAGRDPYIYMAARNTDKTYEEIESAVNRGEKWAEDARQLGKAQVLGCGFGMAWEKFQATAFDQYRLKLTDEESQEAVRSYRESNEDVPQLWRDYENAAIMAVETGKRITVGKCTFSYSKDFLWIALPSGRKLAYRNPQFAWRVREFTKIETCPETGRVTKTKQLSRPKKTLEFWAVNSKTKKWALERTWGGTLTENIVQAAARDLMKNSEVLLEKNRYQIIATVHDEMITQCKKGEVDAFIKIVCTRPEWADSKLPIDAKGWMGPRYRK